MPFRLDLPETFTRTLEQSNRALVGMWLCSGSPINAEICAGSGLDWLLIDGEHAPLSLQAIQTQLQVIAAYPATPVVRVPSGDATIIKQYLDLGAQNLLVPMVDTAEDAAAIISATRYPPEGVRGVGSALSRAARWNRVDDYLGTANSTHVSVIAQIESAEAVANAPAICRSGVDAIFIGPSDLAASMGHLGQQAHPQVVAAIHTVIAAAREAGIPVGINAFDPAHARDYIDGGIDFILVGADVSSLARASEALAQTFITGDSQPQRSSY